MFYPQPIQEYSGISRRSIDQDSLFRLLPCTGSREDLLGPRCGWIVDNVSAIRPHIVTIGFSHPHAPCMVYLPTFGWFLGQMLVNILAPWSIWANGQCLDPVDSMFEHHIFYASGKKNYHEAWTQTSRGKPWKLREACQNHRSRAV